jgi:hypothetical protein
MKRFLALFFGILVRPHRVYCFLHGHPAPLKPGLTGGMNGHGRFDMVFAMTALALNAPMFIFMWVPETIVLLSGSRALADVLFPPVVNEIRQLIPPVWTLVLLMLLLKRESGLGWPAHLAALLPSFFAGAIVAFTYIR